MVCFTPHVLVYGVFLTPCTGLWCVLTPCMYWSMVHPDPSKVLQENYGTLVDSIQDADTLADRLYTKGVIAGNIKEKVVGYQTAKEKNRVLITAVQQQVGVNPISFQTFIDALNMDKSNESVVSLLTGKGLRFGNKYLPPPSPSWGREEDVVGHGDGGEMTPSDVCGLV